MPKRKRKIHISKAHHHETTSSQRHKKAPKLAYAHTTRQLHHAAFIRKYNLRKRKKKHHRGARSSRRKRTRKARTGSIPVKDGDTWPSPRPGERMRVFIGSESTSPWALRRANAAAIWHAFWLRQWERIKAHRPPSPTALVVVFLVCFFFVVIWSWWSDPFLPSGAFLRRHRQRLDHLRKRIRNTLMQTMVKSVRSFRRNRGLGGPNDPPLDLPLAQPLDIENADYGDLDMNLDDNAHLEEMDI